jgi:hypothetical protein
MRLTLVFVFVWRQYFGVILGSHEDGLDVRGCGPCAWS